MSDWCAGVGKVAPPRVTRSHRVRHTSQSIQLKQIATPASATRKGHRHTQPDTEPQSVAQVHSGRRPSPPYAVRQLVSRRVRDRPSLCSYLCYPAAARSLFLAWARTQRLFCLPAAKKARRVTAAAVCCVSPPLSSTAAASATTRQHLQKQTWLRRSRALEPRAGWVPSRRPSP